MRGFGSKCWYKVVVPKLKKLKHRALEAILVGCTHDDHGHKLWDTAKGKVAVSRDVRFDKTSKNDPNSKTGDDWYIDFNELLTSKTNQYVQDTFVAPDKRFTDVLGTINSSPKISNLETTKKNRS